MTPCHLLPIRILLGSMKKYRHYKGKFYRFLGIAKHSESLEDLVIYETQYDNPLGKLWARPKEMFFENIHSDGKSQPRFKQIEIEIIEVKKLNAEQMQWIVELCQKTLGPVEASEIERRIHEFENFVGLIARVDGELSGFKLGYALNKETYYSWLGAVKPNLLRFGIASALHTSLLAFCRRNSFKKLQTKTMNRYKAMLIMNLKNGFDIVGTEQTSAGETKVLMELNLNSN